jgi:PAS domain S-box-containing protein
MNDSSGRPAEDRVLVLAPTAKDARLCCGILAEAGMTCAACSDMPALCRAFEDGVGAALLTEETLSGGGAECLAQALHQQPPWSDLPVLILTSEGANSQLALRTLETLGNVTLMERPVRVPALVSSVRTALRSRRRQYQIRAHVEEHRRSAEAISESENRSRRLMEFHQAVTSNMGEGLYAVDTQGLLTYMNPAAEALFGWSSAELAGRKMHDVTHYQHADGTPFPAEECPGLLVLRRGIVLRDHDDVFIRKDGTFFPVVFTSSPLISDGRTVGLVVVFRDVSQRQQVEEQVRFQARLLDTVGQAAVATDPEGRIIYWNRFAETLYGWSREEAQGRDITEVVVAPAAVEQAAVVMQRLRAGQSWSGEIMVRRRDGTIFPAFVTDTPVIDGQGELRAIIGVSTDISQRKRLEEGLRFLGDASATLTALVDYESTLQKVASLAVPYFADWCAVDLAEGSGLLRRVAVAHVDPAKVRLAQELEQNYPPDPQAPRGAYHVMKTGAPEMMAEIPDTLLVQAARDDRHLCLLRELGLRSYMCVPLQTRGKTLGVISFVAAESGKTYTPGDLAFAVELAQRAAIAIENAQLYSSLREADRLKDEFLAMLAHELRNPLAPIRNALHIMKQPAANGAVLGQSRDMAERQVQHMARLLDDLLDVSRISRGKIELRKDLLDLASVLNRTAEAVRPLIEERGHEFSIALPAGPLRVEGDATRLEQVMTNLLNNAAKYTDPGGRIALSASREGSEIVLRVKDTGIGIAPDMLPRVFDLFVQAERRLDRSQGGVGIGLTLVRKLVELHGGSVEARSEGHGRGSEFVVRLPAPAADARGGQTGAEDGGRPAPALARHRVLVVDDNVDAADSLAMILRLSGQEVRLAYDGPTALLTAQAFRPQVILLDIGMPGMDGYEVARRLREDPRLKPVLLVAMTGWGQEEDRRRSFLAGFDHHLVKPAEPDVLQRLLASSVGLVGL